MQMRKPLEEGHAAAHVVRTAQLVSNLQYDAGCEFCEYYKERRPARAAMLTTSAPGKCILLGEHAVVYGHPALAVAIDLRMRVNLSASKAERDVHHVDGRPLLPEKHPHITGALARLWPDSEGRSRLNIFTESELPAAAGLGSSAALSVGLSAALSAAASGSEQIDAEQISLLSHQLEAAAQSGIASPMDTATSTHGGCVMLGSERLDDSWLYTRELGGRTWDIHCFDPPGSLKEARLVIGHTGIHASTSELVRGLRERLESEPDLALNFNAIAALTKHGVDAMRSGDLPTLGAVMDLNHRHLQNLGVSCPELDRLVLAARDTALGAKLTGAGGGGCMIALSIEPRATSDAIELAGGRSFICSMGAEGVRIEHLEEL